MGYAEKKEVSQVGLGLWISHRIITSNGGRIQVKSKPGAGSVFLIILPLSEKNSNNCLELQETTTTKHDN